MKGILRGCPHGDLMQFLHGHCDTDLDSSASKLQDEVSKQKAGIPSLSLTSRFKVFGIDSILQNYLQNSRGQ